MGIGVTMLVVLLRDISVTIVICQHHSANPHCAEVLMYSCADVPISRRFQLGRLEVFLCSFVMKCVRVVDRVHRLRATL